MLVATHVTCPTLQPRQYSCVSQAYKKIHFPTLLSPLITYKGPCSCYSQASLRWSRLHLSSPILVWVWTSLCIWVPFSWSWIPPLVLPESSLPDTWSSPEAFQSLKLPLLHSPQFERAMHGEEKVFYPFSTVYGLNLRYSVAIYVWQF